MRKEKKFKFRLPDFFRYTPSGMVWYLWLKITKKEVVIGGECLACGRCCHALNLNLSERWLRTEKEFEKFCEESPEYRRFIICDRTPAGLLSFECTCLSPEGYCSDYENRPDICRDYPVPDLLFSGARLLDYCGYRFDIVPSFKKILDREKKK